MHSKGGGSGEERRGPLRSPFGSPCLALTCSPTTTFKPAELSVIFICSSPIHLTLNSRQQRRNGKMKKIRRKRATVAPYSMLYRFLCNALQRASQKAKKYGANAPQLHPI